MNLDGSGVVLVSHDSSFFEPGSTSFSRDGTKVLFSDSARTGDYANDLYQINVDGTGLVNLTNGVGDNRSPKYSSDGTRIVFACSAEVCVMNTDGSGRTELDLDEFRALSPSFSPDGTKIAYSSYRGDFDHPSNYEIFLINADGSGEPVQVTSHENTGDLDPTFGWQLDSDDDCVIDPIDNCPIHINPEQLDTDSDGQGNACDDDDDNDGVDDQFDSCPLAANQYRVAFASSRSGSTNYEIYSQNVDGSGVTRLTTTSTSVIDDEPSFSSDGSRILFTSNRNNSRDEIFVMNSNGTGVTRLTNIAGGNNQAVFSPDGTKIAFVSRRFDNNQNLFIMNSDGSNQTQLTFSPQPVLSPFIRALITMGPASYLKARGESSETPSGISLQLILTAPARCA